MREHQLKAVVAGGSRRKYLKALRMFLMSWPENGGWKEVGDDRRWCLEDGKIVKGLGGVPFLHFLNKLTKFFVSWNGKCLIILILICLQNGKL